MATRLAISGTLTDRSRAMSIRNGARVVPLAATVNMASEAAASSSHGSRSVGASRAVALAGRSVAVIRAASPAACHGRSLGRHRSSRPHPDAPPGQPGS